ncbi:MAG TPA: CAP domain-containing protein [Solirubrobacterales bacterium]|nr:CAP domain-containing protein [Solirubrobacterales bacterium]
MASKFSTALAIAALACLVLVPNAVAVGVGEQRAVAATQASAAPRTATTSALIAPSANCPDQSSLTSPVAEQEQAMLCMTNFARANAGLGELAEAPELDQSAAGKAADVLRCDEFSHFACGREFTYWIRAAGYIGEGCWHAGENLAWGTGEYGSVRAIFRAWMNSPAHRQNILGDYSQVGISLLSGNLEGNSGAQIWASHFGSHCEG